MRHKKRPPHNAKSILGAMILMVIIILIVICASKAEASMRPAASMQAEHFALRTANDCVSEAVSEYLDENKFTYSDFAAVLYGENGKVTSIETIPSNINRVQAGLTLAVNKGLEKNADSVHEIPIGSLTGSYMLAGKGPDMKIRICPAEQASVRLESSFCSAGINQTSHRISAVITVDIKSSLPIYSFESKAEFEFLIAENVIVGEVPELSRYTWNDLG